MLFLLNKKKGNPMAWLNRFSVTAFCALLMLPLLVIAATTQPTPCSNQPTVSGTPTCNCKPMPGDPTNNQCQGAGQRIIVYQCKGACEKGKVCVTNTDSNALTEFLVTSQ